ncbi:MAG: hypothetical protein ACE5QV_09075, partial [Fidelibacterota bacterium]
MKKIVFLILLALPSPLFSQKNHVIYEIDVTLDVEEKVLEGHQTITYINRTAEDPIKELYLNLYPNAFSSRNTMMAEDMERNGNYKLAYYSEKELGWLEIKNLKVNGTPVSSSVDGTVLKIDLPGSLAAGDTVLLEMDTYLKIPKTTVRMGYREKNYTLAQWYPQMARYEKGYGWHAHQYRLNGEFCLDFADFHVKMTLPANYYVGATGALIDTIGGNNNIPDALIEKEKKGKKEKEDFKNKTLIWEAKNVRDFAWVASPDYVKVEDEWEGIKVVSIFFKGHRKRWKDSARWGAEILKFFSEKFGKYP